MTPKFRIIRRIMIAALALAPMGSGRAAVPGFPQSHQGGLSTEYFVTASEAGSRGGRLVVALRGEPKTLNPVTAVDSPSREVLWRMMADLVHINRYSQQTEPALAKWWKISSDGLRYTLKLRRGLRFSDGHRLDADDVAFSFQVYLDKNVHAPQRDLLLLEGKPIRVRKASSDTVVFELPQAYGAGERLFDGFAILPRHLLEQAYQEGRLAQAWGLNTPAAQMAGAGPFRLKEYLAGQRMVLERNPYYWKADGKGNALPYLDEVVFLFVGNEDAQVIRFQSGETDLLSRINAQNYTALATQERGRGFTLHDSGPGLEFNFLFFNLNDLSGKPMPQIARKQGWFRQAAFRQAVSAAIDREGIVRLIYQGRGTPLWGPVTPGNKLWSSATASHPARSIERARQLLRDAGFRWKEDGALVDSSGAAVEFTIVTSVSSSERTKMAAILQDDLKQLGMQVHVAPMEFRALLTRIFDTKEYEACILGLANGDADPNPEMNYWLSSGPQHLWSPSEPKPATPWEAEIDRLMKQQLAARRAAERRRLYERVQKILAENQPLIFLASPHVLVGAKNGLGNFRPAVLESYTLWNVEELFWRRQ